ncbi:MAG: anthranilate synthase component I [Bacteroidota bacterium]
MISFEEFERLSQQHNVIPLVRTTLADLHTPVSAYLALRRTDRFSFLLESVERDEKIGRYSFVGVDPLAVIRARDGEVEIERGGNRSTDHRNIFEVLAHLSARYRQHLPAGLGGFLGGFVGYIGYPAVRHLERIGLRTRGETDEDEAVFGLFGSVLRFDHRRQTVMIVHNVFIDGSKSIRQAYDEGRQSMDALELRLRRSVVAPHRFSCERITVDGGRGKENFCAAVARAKEYIREGEIFQVVLTRRLEFRFTGDLFPVYRALRIINPSPYLFYLDFGDIRLAGSSPEALVRVSEGAVEVLPIAGTRRRGQDETEDKLIEAELLKDRKELAEHVMLVDLGRNDVGKVSDHGSVCVPTFKHIERYSHVMHIVSGVQGRLKQGLCALDAIKACFPAGTVTGAPKVRAMEIISELEPVPRGVYAGAVGYLAFDGSLDTCIAIRTIVAYGGRLLVQAGAGIVADSIPETEYQETVNKAGALIEALRRAGDGVSSVVNHDEFVEHRR